MRLEDVIIKPLITEKGTLQKEKMNEYFFAVDPRANKYLIREAVETIFKVHVVGIWTMNMEGKRKRVGRHFGKTNPWKKAIVRLKEKETIKIFEAQAV